MKTFRFRLEAVLTLRKQAEQAAQRQCALAYAAVELAAKRLDSANAALAKADEARRARLARGLTAEELEQMRDYTLVLEDHRTRATRELAECRDRAEQARTRLVTATQHREALDRLREHQRLNHDYHSAREAQRMLDELSARGFAAGQVRRETSETTDL